MIDYLEILENIQKKEINKKPNLSIKLVTNFNSMFIENYLTYYLKQKKIFSKIQSSQFDQVDQSLIKFKNKKYDFLIIIEDINAKQNFNDHEYNHT